MKRVMILLLSVLFAFCNNSEIIVPARTPDLIISKVTAERLPNCWNGPNGGVYCGGPRFEFTVSIKNIGDASVNQSFYITNSRSNADFNNQYCSHAMIVNYPSGDILPNDSLIVKFIDFIDDSTTNILLAVNTNNSFNHSEPLPTIHEQRYDNNLDTLELQW